MAQSKPISIVGLSLAMVVSASIIGGAIVYTGNLDKPIAYPTPTPDLVAELTPTTTVIKRTIYEVTPTPIPPPPQKVIRKVIKTPRVVTHEEDDD